MSKKKLASAHLSKLSIYKSAVEKSIKKISDSPKIVETSNVPRPNNHLTPAPPVEIPWTLEQFFNGEIDLDVELSSRFQNMPVMSVIKTRSMGNKSGREVATLSTQDNSADVVIDADPNTHVIQLSFTYGSMVSLKFNLRDISDVDRRRWLELMRREQGGLAFLWGALRWESDYLICIARKHFTNIYAFSPSNFQAAIHMTPGVTRPLLGWLEKMWAPEEQEDDVPPLLTW